VSQSNEEERTLVNIVTEIARIAHELNLSKEVMEKAALISRYVLKEGAKMHHIQSIVAASVYLAYQSECSMDDIVYSAGVHREDFDQAYRFISDKLKKR